MIFPGMDEHDFATFFIVVKQDQIKQELNIKKLYIEMAIKTVYDFVLKNKDNIQSKFKNQYDKLFDDGFYADIIKLLKDAKKHGIPMEFEL